MYKAMIPSHIFWRCYGQRTLLKMAMSSWTLVTEYCFFVTALVALVVVVQSFLSWFRLRHFSGPPFASLSKLWIVKRTLKQNLHTELKRVCDEYGKACPENQLRRLFNALRIFGSHWS